MNIPEAARPHYVDRGTAKAALRAAGKIKATTGAGIYAKALLCKYSVTGAAQLVKSLAEDLIACSELRARLWPATLGETP